VVEHKHPIIADLEAQADFLPTMHDRPFEHLLTGERMRFQRFEGEEVEEDHVLPSRP
jgi:hypothetical protein